MNFFKPRISRRSFLISLGCSGAGTAAYTKWWEPDWLGVGRHQVKLGRGNPSPLRMLQMSDFHASEVVSLGFIQRAIQTGLELKPDLICLTGDFITSKYRELDRFIEILSALAKVAPTFACLGNHDGGAWAGRSHGYSDTKFVRELLTKSRIELLDNRSTAVRIHGWKLNLVGVGDLWAGELRPEPAFANNSPDAATILLSHNPDSKTDLLPYRWDVMLCGHTHGGQIELPLLGTPFAPVRDKRFVKGLHRWNDRWIHITKGVGNLHGLRFNCRPEVSLLTLT